jgi:hypothetical protein
VDALCTVCGEDGEAYADQFAGGRRPRCGFCGGPLARLEPARRDPSPGYSEALGPANTR